MIKFPSVDAFTNLLHDSGLPKEQGEATVPSMTSELRRAVQSSGDTPFVVGQSLARLQRARKEKLEPR